MKAPGRARADHLSPDPLAGPRIWADIGECSMGVRMRMISLVFAASALFVLPGCTAAGTLASVAGSVISTTVEVTGDVIGGAARTVSGSSKGDREQR